jgi:hypothetical protein
MSSQAPICHHERSEGSAFLPVIQPIVILRAAEDLLFN